ncbi:amidase domain-containing protein [Wukongibacter baidiensis]|uniref:amidase domain-containing protein n=1 Tax=Wukongibacter baidiensis TaxID=1723361 RepID=UPI003D7F80E1
MIIVVSRKKFLLFLVGIVFLIAILLLIYGIWGSSIVETFNPGDDEVDLIIKDYFDLRNNALIEGDIDTVASLYDRSHRYGVWAYEHEKKKLKYIEKWTAKQGVKMYDVKSLIKVTSKKKRENGYRVNFTASTEYWYYYNNQFQKRNMFRIGTYHSIDIKKVDGVWKISREWYTDPFADSLHINGMKSDEITEYILSQNKSDYKVTNERRLKAMEYADRYCGAASDEEYGMKYNKKYKNYNPLGGDCANFASQILYEGGKFRMTGSWKYGRGATKAWVNAQGFKNYMLYSGRASKIAYGSYEKVLKASYKLLPGDFIAYEKNGKVTHISVVSGADSRGYAYVHSHNTDRYKVPWDLGWSNKGIKFWLVRVHY